MVRCSLCRAQHSITFGTRALVMNCLFVRLPVLQCRFVAPYGLLVPFLGKKGHKKIFKKFLFFC
jgi:hypothetical protein